TASTRVNANKLINRLKDLNWLFIVLRFACFISLRNAEVCRKIGVNARNRPISTCFCGFRAVKKRLNEFDLKLLEQIQQNNRFSADELAEKVCLSPSVRSIINSLACHTSLVTD